jgi:hypothetical protein
MLVAYRPQLPLKNLEHRTPGEEKEVGNTRTIGSAKAYERHRCAGEPGAHLRPLVLTTLGIIGIPDVLEVGAGAQVVDVPVGP